MDSIANDSAYFAAFILMIVVRRGKAIGQSQNIRGQRNWRGLRKPAVKEERARLTVPPHVGSKIEKSLFTNAPERQRQRIKLAGPEVSHGYGYHADARVALEQVQLESGRNMRAQNFRRNKEMQKQNSFPLCEQEWINAWAVRADHK